MAFGIPGTDKKLGFTGLKDKTGETNLRDANTKLSRKPNSPQAQTAQINAQTYRDAQAQKVEAKQAGPRSLITGLQRPGTSEPNDSEGMFSNPEHVFPSPFVARPAPVIPTLSASALPSLQYGSISVPVAGPSSSAPVAGPSPANTANFTAPVSNPTPQGKEAVFLGTEVADLTNVAPGTSISDLLAGKMKKSDAETSNDGILRPRVLINVPFLVSGKPFPRLLRYHDDTVRYLLPPLWNTNVQRLTLADYEAWRRYYVSHPEKIIDGNDLGILQPLSPTEYEQVFDYNEIFGNHLTQKVRGDRPTRPNMAADAADGPRPVSVYAEYETTINNLQAGGSEWVPANCTIIARDDLQEGENIFQDVFRVRKNLEVSLESGHIIAIGGPDFYKLFDDEDFDHVQDVMTRLSNADAVGYTFGPTDNIVKRAIRGAHLGGEWIRPDVATLLLLAGQADLAQNTARFTRALAVASPDALDLVARKVTRDRPFFSVTCMQRCVRDLAKLASAIDARDLPRPGDFPPWFDRGGLIRKAASLVTVYVKSCDPSTADAFDKSIKHALATSPASLPNSDRNRLIAIRKNGIEAGIYIGGALDAASQLTEKDNRKRDMLKDGISGAITLAFAAGHLPGVLIGTAIAAGVQLAIDYAWHSRNFQPAANMLRGALETEELTVRDRQYLKSEPEHALSSYIDAARYISWLNAAIHCVGQA